MKLSKYKRNILIFPIVCACLFFSFIPIHKYYFSLTEVKITSSKKSIEVSCKLFTDDLEEALFKLQKKKIDLATSTGDKNIQVVVFKYITDRFKIYFQNKPVKLNFVGFEIEDDVTWCYLESTINPKASKQIKITNTLLYDFLSEQTNLIQFQWDEMRKSGKLNSPQKEATFDF